MERWTTDIIEWADISPESAQLFIAQGEARLKATEETASSLDSSNDRMMNIITSLLSVSLGYMFAGSQEYLQAVSFFVLCISTVSGAFLLSNLKSYPICTVGEEPKMVFTSQFIDNSYSPSQQYLNLVCQVMETIQYKISHNHLVNTQRRARLDRAKRVALFIPLAFLLAALYQYWLGYHLVWHR